MGHVIRCQLRWKRDSPLRGQSSLESTSSTLPLGRVPRVARLMALALRFEQQLADGHVADYAQLARLGHVTRARISQIMDLLLLAPDIQEALLFLPRTEKGPDPLNLRDLQPIVRERCWATQREMWRSVVRVTPLASCLANAARTNQRRHFGDDPRWREHESTIR